VVRSILARLPSPARRRLLQLYRTISGKHALRRSFKMADSDVMKRGLRTVHLVRSRLLPIWAEVDRFRGHRPTGAPTLSVLVGTLHTDEPQLDACRQAIRDQDFDGDLEHVVISGLPKVQADDRLFQTFLRSGRDVLIKVDADMVVHDHSFVTDVVRFFKDRPDIDLLQMSVTDTYSAGPMQGVNAYARRVALRAVEQDRAFTDRPSTPVERRWQVPTRFLEAVTHAPNPSRQQAVRFGIQCGTKVLAALAEAERPLARSQLIYLERAYQAFQQDPDPTRAMFCFGAERALRGDSDIADVDVNLGLGASGDRVVPLLSSSRSTALRPEIAALREEARQAIGRSAAVRDVLFLVPHARLYGGVLRFFALGRALRAAGAEATIAMPDAAFNTQPQIDNVREGPYSDVPVAPLSTVTGRSWDVAICGDYSSGLLCLLPYLPARRTAAYLLTGWATAMQNERQIDACRPDLVIANSSYVASQYPGLLPHVLPGGIDLDIFSPRPMRAREPGSTFRIGTPGGRDLPRKRLDDALAACKQLVNTGVALELHVWTAAPLERRLPEFCVVHEALSRSSVAALLRTMDVVLCPEEDAGWNNPAAEAMATGIPVVCTPAGTTDFATDEVSALVVEPRDVDGFVQALRRILADPDLAASLRQAGIDHIGKFTWPHVAANLVSIIEKVMPGAPDPMASQLTERRVRAELRQRTRRRTSAEESSL
jgi:glycosyltransferase involved in cell wall biosynthesis